MTTAHEKEELFNAYSRLSEMFRSAGRTFPVVAANRQGEVVRERFEYDRELEVLSSQDPERIRSWARDVSLRTDRRYPEEIQKALSFLASAYVREREYRLDVPVSYVEGGEYAGDNSGLTVRPGTYPVVRMNRYADVTEDCVLVTVDGENTFVNRIGACTSVRKREIRGERRSLQLSYLEALRKREEARKCA